MTEAWEAVCRVEELDRDRPAGRLVGSSGQDRDRVCVVTGTDGRPQALLDRCPHRDIALSGGIVREGRLVCPGHFWRFDLTTGRRTDRPEHAVTLYPTRVVDGWVQALLPAPAPRRSMREWLLAQARERSPAVPDTPAQDPRGSQDPEVGEVVDVAGVATNHHDVGSGPPVLLVHGSGPGVSAWANWRLTLPALAPRFRVLAPDLLGFGHTAGAPGRRHDLDAWTAHLVGFLDALDLERVSVVGNSFGGALALSLATRHPHRVERLALMGSVGVRFELTEALDAVWGFDPARDDMRELLSLFAHDASRVDDGLARLRLAAATRPGVHEAYRSMFPAPRQSGVDALTLPEEDIRALRHRTLVVHGRDDRVIPLETSLRLHRLIDDSRLHVFGRCGHWAQIEHADAFNRLLADFLTP